uniref:Ceramide synthase 6-like n=1 Tax=Hirondellea gigas TaxID=1518452 RepID=A0A2P2HXB6_9CRUS
MEWIGASSIWVPPGYTWENLTQYKDLRFPDARDLLIYPIAIAFVQFILKYAVLTPYVYISLSKHFGIISEGVSQRYQPNEKLEQLFQKYGHSVPEKIAQSAAVSLGLTERQLERWFRHRVKDVRNTVTKKFADCAWQLSYYSASCLLGIFVLYDKPWFYDVRRCWDQFPLQSVSTGVWCYYMFALGFYCLETLTHFSHPKRTDHAQLLVHHICALLLLSCTWISNTTRLGTLTILLFECNDIPLLLAKLFGYCGFYSMKDLFFVIFVFIWISTRIIIFPLFIMREALVETYFNAGAYFHIYYIVIVLLFVILAMNLMWTYSIFHVIIKRLNSDKVSDVRSSDEELTDDENERKKKR